MNEGHKAVLFEFKNDKVYIHLKPTGIEVDGTNFIYIN